MNVKSKGYGLISQEVMRGSELSIGAKTVYAFLCSYAGVGAIAFPKAEKIADKLQISKANTYKYIKELKSQGIIKTKRTPRGNIYTLIPNEKNSDYIANAKHKWKGSVSKIAMQDERITMKAKAIYAYFCSFSDFEGNDVCPHRDTLFRELGMCENTYYTHLKLLKECGYIKSTQRKNKGRYSVCDYKLCNDIPSYRKAYREKNKPTIPTYIEKREYSYMTKEKIKEIIDIEYQNTQIVYAAENKEMLHQFGSQAEKESYINRLKHIVYESTNILYKLANNHIVAYCDDVDYQLAKYNIRQNLTKEKFTEMMLNVGEHYKEIKNLNAYLKKSLLGFAMFLI